MKFGKITVFNILYSLKSLMNFLTVLTKQVLLQRCESM